MAAKSINITVEKDEEGFTTMSHMLINGKKFTLITEGNTATELVKNIEDVNMFMCTLLKSDTHVFTIDLYIKNT